MQRITEAIWSVPHTGSHSAEPAQTWEADTLPAELLPLRFTLSYSVCLNAKAILRQSVGYTALVQRVPDEVCGLRSEHVEGWMIQLLGRWKPATVNKRYRGLQAFFRWCLDEDIIARGGSGPRASAIRAATSGRSQVVVSSPYRDTSTWR